MGEGDTVDDREKGRMWGGGTTGKRDAGRRDNGERGHVDAQGLGAMGEREHMGEGRADDGKGGEGVTGRWTMRGGEHM